MGAGISVWVDGDVSGVEFLRCMGRSLMIESNEFGCECMDLWRPASIFVLNPRALDICMSCLGLDIQTSN